MPQVIPWAISALGAAVGGAAGAFLIMNAAVIAAGVMLVGTLALSQYQRRKAERQARAQFDAAQVDRLANVPTTVASRELVRGRLRKGGHVFFRSSVGQFKERFVMCIALAAHEIDGVERIYFNDIPVDIDANDQVTTAPWGRWRRDSFAERVYANVTTLAHVPSASSVTAVQRVYGPSDGGNEPVVEPVAYTLAGSVLTITGYDPLWNYYCVYQSDIFYSNAMVRWKLGAPGQAADDRLQALFPGVWTADHRASGVAYLICEFNYDETSFPSGIPAVTALVRGAKLYDPRTTLTQFSENPALMMRDLLLHPQFGKRSSITAAEDARIVAAANECDATMSYFGTDTVQKYRAATVLPFGTLARDALDDFSQAMGGQWAYAAGEFFVRAGVYQAPVLALTDADLAVVQRSSDGATAQNPITISTHRARNEKINTVAIRIWDQGAGYIQTPIDPFKGAALIAADGAELVQEVTMPAVFYAGQAYHVAGIMLRDSRDPLTVTLPFKLRAYPLEMFDSVTLTLARYGWVAKEFQILSRNFMPDGYVQLMFKETSAAIFQYGGGFLPAGYADNSGLPRPWDITPPTITTISSGETELVIQTDGTIVNAVRVVWLPIQDATVAQGGTVEVQYMVVGEWVWRSVSVPGADTQAIFTGVNDRALVIVRARTRNSVAVSNWTVQITHQVVGKTEPPPNIENLTISGSVLSWSLPRRVPDLAGYVFRFHYGNNLDWGTAAPLHNGFLTESPYDLVTRPGGVVTIMGKAVDTSGNESVASANIVMDLGDPPVANIVEQWDFDALGWPAAPGEQSGWTIVSGDPSADALDSFYGTDEQSFYGEDNDSLYDAGAYSQMVYVTTEVFVNSALAGSVMTLALLYQGVDLHIDYRLAGPGSFYELDNSSFYGADDDPFYGAPGDWRPWPGQLVAANDIYQFRVTIGAGVQRGILQGMVLSIDAPDIEESLADVAISSSGTAIPYTKPFTSIKVVQATLQANGSGAETVEVDKAALLAPVIRAFNSAHTAVSGATADIVVKGY